MKAKGKIIKALGGFYYILSQGEVYEARARGVFRHRKITPLVGDQVLFSQGEGEALSYVEEILDRKNSLKRPPVANIDQVFLLVPVAEPDYNLYLVDKLIAYYEYLNIDILLVISKKDLDPDQAQVLKETYQKAGFPVFTISTKTGQGMGEIYKQLVHKTSALAGVSGAGKTSFLNDVLGLDLETQAVSEKSQRGRHTTRHSELMAGPDGILIFDTPGFSSIDVEDIPSEDLGHYFRDFQPYLGQCKFQDCIHKNEPGCEIRRALLDQEIEESRYENYIRIYDDLLEKEKNTWR
ncbi:MAG: ribosome small subunit-dependent GTPase A [Tissierellia bacterium]|nr:ribosome small subunit-dependent GTPase A [Tissierellia bacterium]